MTRVIGWTMLILNVLWFALIPFAKVEPSLCQIISSAAGVIAGAILAK